MPLSSNFFTESTGEKKITKTGQSTIDYFFWPTLQCIQCYISAWIDRYIGLCAACYNFSAEQDLLVKPAFHSCNTCNDKKPSCR